MKQVPFPDRVVFGDWHGVLLVTLSGRLSETTPGIRFTHNSWRALRGSSPARGPTRG